MISQEPEPEVGPGLLESLWRFKWLVAGIAVVGALAGYFYAQQQPVLYRASARVLLEDPRNRIALSDSNDAFLDSSRFVRNQAQIVMSDTVLRRAAEKLDASPGSLAVDADPLLDIDAIDVSAVDADPQRAADVVDAVGAAYEQVTREESNAAGEAAIAELEQARSEVEAQLSALDDEDGTDPVVAAERQAATDQLQVLATRIRQLSVDTALAGSGVKLRETAIAPSQPYRPRPLRTAGAAGILALIAASALAWLWNTRHPPPGQRQEVADIFGAPCLGEIPLFDPDSKQIPSIHTPRSPAAEAYQFLVAAIGLTLDRSGARSLLVTSAEQGDGKTVTALNLAVVAEGGGRSVALIDADERLRSLTKAVGATVTVGLPQVAVEGVPPDWALTKTSLKFAPTLRVAGMVHGDKIVNPADFFRSTAFPMALNRLAQDFEMVIVDAPPLLAVAEASAIAATVDAVLVVMDQGTPEELLVEMRRRLDLVDANVIGYVVNRASRALSPYSYGENYGPAADEADTVSQTWSSPARTAPGRSSG